jgi:hypothetical protein
MTIDYTGLVASITGMIAPAVTAAMPIAGTILAVGIAWKLFKRFTK